jgi:hypothetical protein
MVLLRVERLRYTASINKLALSGSDYVWLAAEGLSGNTFYYATRLVFKNAIQALCNHGEA